MSATATECHYPEQGDRPAWVLTVVRLRNGADLVIVAGEAQAQAEGRWADGLCGGSWPTEHRARYLNDRFFGPGRRGLDARTWATLDRLYRKARAALGPA